MRAWLIRAGESGSRDLWCLQNGFAGGGWTKTPDLTNAASPAEIQSLLERNEPGNSRGAITNWTYQLWRLRHEIQKDDLVILPLKSTKEIAIGVVTSTYEYLANEEDPGKRHIVRVDWKRIDLPRTAVGQDLLYSLGAFLTICEIKRNDAVKRLESLMLQGTDPGSRIISKSDNSVAHEAEQESDLTNIDIEQIAYDTIVARINEKFLGHEMTRLVEAVLISHGFKCERKPAGADGGVDILAGSGPLGLDSPKVVVQVKSQSSQVGDEVVQTLQGAITRFGADQALLVAWGGVNKNARAFLETEKFTIRVWDSDEFIQQILTHYGTFEEDLKAAFPLKRVWTLSPEID